MTDNIHDVLATYISKKHSINLEQVNHCLNKSYVFCDVEIYDEDLMHYYDRYIENEQRILTGSYYTPYALAEKMVSMAFQDYYRDYNIDKRFFIEPYALSNEELALSLDKIKLADIACGSGVFLVAAIKMMISYYKSLNHPYEIDQIIDRVYGFDLQEEPLEIYHLLLLDMALNEGGQLNQVNIILGDTLLSREDYQFDLIIGNPPYVGEKGHKALFDGYKHLDGYEGRMDLFYFFIYKGYKYLKEDGLLFYITTNYFITADGANKLRAFLKENVSFVRLINLDECKMFSEAKGMHNLIFSFTKVHVEEVSINVIAQTKLKSLNRLTETQYMVLQNKIFSETDHILLYENKVYYDIINKILSKSLTTLGQVVKINQGIVSGADKVTKAVIKKKMDPSLIDQYGIKEGDPIYVFDDPMDSSFMKPFYKNSQIRSYKILDQDKRYILYVKDGDLEEGMKEYEHLLPFKELLSNRREVKTGRREWYALQWGRDQSIFDGEKIVVPQRANLNYFAYTDQPFYSSADVYYLTEGPLKFLLGYLNSKISYFWLYNRGKRKGKALELYANPLQRMPIPMINYAIIEEHVEKVLLGGSPDEIDACLYEFFELSNEEIEIVEELYSRGN
ncbi:hypothetical protein EZV73_09190 [Acidaminobacter sp. JC074]|uniref:Eco57I restriction-modification methylase domain-containing protein n=1 Tax=Acidaminobacter sp. JC074 TaxID=2530199 RepID=UPI001F0F2C00|nr:N-6 DNA methylase [Acidaminobacter sp. JC074]MCH4887747.1 hypothetical protein [Acidaminobacter sp. JC074]